ncbi:MAG: PIN domain-containing protein [Melioribacteraceae bacterium]|nr:PIN domain-containing protein [Melioribacteraceae bacterium]MCF8356072.1 PIN domain-containing protein [Melioribacteraceae bacterium]MCF8394899.1 PIN domain-containing protein [Melioribacteraceae bacterium]MCF8420432.1 PIN domain-containing protein [Melioribacteraceae bacterium]
MILLVDTDILLDIALKRMPFFEDSVKVVDQVQNKKFIGFIAWHTISNFYYLTASGSEKKKAKEFIKDFVEFVNVAQTNTADVKKAVQLKVPDFEDALQISAAMACNADFIITRNVKHYKNSPIAALTPTAFLKKFS